MKAKEESNAIMNAIKHPELYCPICWKKVGVCKHSMKPNPKEKR